MRRPAGRRRPGLAIAACLALAACLSDAPVASEAPTATPEPEPTPDVTRYALDTTAWYGGFVIRFGTAVATLDPKGGPVAISLDVTNPGDDDATLSGPLRLVSGERTLEPTRESELPLIPAHGRTLATITFEADTTFNVDAAAIVVGRPSEHQASIPLRSPGMAVTLEPLSVELDAGATAGTLRLELRGAELRADLPDWRQELGPRSLALTLTYDATFRSDFVGGLPFTADSVSLQLADGTVVSPRHDGRSQSILVLEPGRRAAGLASRFEVPEPGAGDYVLVFTDGTTTGTIGLTVPARAIAAG